MFWGLELKPGTHCEKTVDLPFHVSRACAVNLPGMWHLKIRHNSHDYVLCCLGGSNEEQMSSQGQQVLNLNFSKGEHIEFFLTPLNKAGANKLENDSSVFLTGFHQSPDTHVGHGTKINGHCTPAEEENAIISIKKRPLPKDEEGEEQDSGVSSSKMPKVAASQNGGKATISDLVNNLSAMEDDDEDEDFSASAVGLNPDSTDNDEDDEDEEEESDPEDGLDLEEDELAGLKADLEISVTDLRETDGAISSTTSSSGGKSKSSSSSSAAAGSSSRR